MIDLKLLRYLTSHPLNRRTRFRALLPMMRWRIATRLMSGCEFVMPFANGARLIVTPGRWGSEANALCGLHEFSDMGFLLHFLRPSDLFCDIGANIGAYTVLASAGVGARSLACEPIASSYAELRKNMYVNHVADLVDVRRVAAGKSTGTLTLTSQKDTMNHVITGTVDGPSETIGVDTLDHLLAGRTPALIKIDVEGWEQEVLQGAAQTLRQPDLFAIIIELNRSGERYGFNDGDVHQTLVEHGYSSYRYQPFERALIGLDGKYNSGGNTLYVRNVEFVSERLRSAPPFTVRDFRI